MAMQIWPFYKVLGLFHGNANLGIGYTQQNLTQKWIWKKIRTWLDQTRRVTLTMKEKEQKKGMMHNLLIPEKLERNGARFALLLLCHVNVCEGYHPNSIALSNKQTFICKEMLCYFYQRTLKWRCFLNHSNGNVIFTCNRTKKNLHHQKK